MMNKMDPTQSTMAQKVARAAHDFLRQSTGRAPKSVTVVLSENTLVITLNEALSDAEKDLAKSPEGAAQVQEFHRQLFATSAVALRETISKITGVPVKEAAVEVEPVTGTVFHAFTSGTMVQIFLLGGDLTSESWNEPGGGNSHE